ncbi:MAG TPA: ComEC/Rec2 family competence protein [Terriglobia bacterium]|nr:ComEC/Rec2 family competence protein [Terriglobia bacterium]
MRSPLLVLAGCFALGILSAHPEGRSAGEIIQAVSYLLAIAGICLIPGLALLRASKYFPSLLFALIGFGVAGAAASFLFEARFPINHVRYLDSSGIDLADPVRMEGVLASIPFHTRYGIQFDLGAKSIEVRSAGRGNELRPWTGIIRVRLEASGDSGAWPAINALHLQRGDGIRALVWLQKPRVYRNPGSFDFRHYLQSVEDVYWLGTIKNPHLVEKLAGNKRAGFSKLLEKARQRLIRSIDTLYPPWSGEMRDGAVLKAVLLGERTSLDSDTIDNFRKTGLYHLLVIAGLHIGLLALIGAFLLRRTPLRQTWRVALLLAFLLAYSLLVEQRASTLRALLMIFVYLVARLLYREHGALNAVGLAALALLLYRPAWLFETEFELSFAAALLIVGLAVPILMLTTEPYWRALGRIEEAGLDFSFKPGQVQFRLDLRALILGLKERVGLTKRHPAVASLAVTAPIRLALWTGNILLFSAILQIGLLLPMAMTFHRVAISGIGLNALAIPVMVLLLATAIPTVLLGTIAPSLAAWPAKLVDLIMKCLFSLTDWPSLPAWLSFRVSEPPAWVAWGFVISVVIAALTLGRKPRLFWTSMTGQLVFATLISLHPFAPQIPGGVLEVTSLDCGGGDAIFVVLPDRTTLLMDAGGRRTMGAQAGHFPGRRWDPGEDIVSPYLWSRGIDRIDVLVLTDSRQEHLGGLGSLIRNFDVGEFWHGKNQLTDSYRDLLEEVRQHGIRTRELAAGDRFERGITSISTLWPPANSGMGSSTRTPSHDNALVLRISSGEASVLLSGGISDNVERALLLSGSALTSHTLGVALDDSRTSSASRFVDRVSPLVAVVNNEAGNRLKTASLDVLDRLRTSGAQVFGTDVRGAVTVEMQGASISVHTYRTSLAD